MTSRHSVQRVFLHSPPDLSTTSNITDFSKLCLQLDSVTVLCISFTALATSEDSSFTSYHPQNLVPRVFSSFPNFFVFPIKHSQSKTKLMISPTKFCLLPFFPMSMNITTIYSVTKSETHLSLTTYLQSIHFS